MNKNFKTLLMCISIPLITFIAVNLAAFLVDVSQSQLANSWSYRWQHGTFYLNDVPSGLQFGSKKTNLFLGAIFTIALAVNYKKGNFTFTNDTKN